MNKALATFATSFVCCTLVTGTGIAQNTPAIITPTDATHFSGIAPNGIGATTTQLLFSQPYCGSQTRGVYTASTPTVNGTVYSTNIAVDFTLPSFATCGTLAFPGAENYFIISPGLTGFPAGSVYTTNPDSASSDSVLKDGAPFISGISDVAIGHAGITFDTVGTFQNALIVTTASQVVGFDGSGTKLFNYLTPTGFQIESGSVAPQGNTACPGCLYVTATALPLGQNLPGAIYTIAPGTASGTLISTKVTSTPVGQIEPESILFVPQQACTLNGTNFSYFVSAYAANDQRDNNNTNNGDLLAYTQAQLATVAGQALVPFEGGIIYSFNPTTHAFTPFSTPVPIPAGSPGLYQLEGASMVACAPPPTSVTGRMTGGGSFFTPDGMRVTHGLEIHCTVPSAPNTLEVNWGGGNNFHMDALTTNTCFLDPSIDQGHPAADFNTMIGTGTGTLNGAPATVSFEFTDAGEPGTSDKATVTINSGASTFTVPLTVLDKGNQQAHNN